MIRAFFMALVLAGPVIAQTLDDPAPVVDEIIGKARAECTAQAEPGGPKPNLVFEPGAITWLDLDGEFEPNDLILDFNFIVCSAVLSLWHGSGGSLITVVLNGEKTATWSGGRWRVAEFGGATVLLIGRHGSHCDSFGARACVQAVVVDEEGFAVVGDTSATGW